MVGVLDVRVEEQDGTLQTYQVNTANIPYLSRPGAVRYKLHSGKAGSQPRETDGPCLPAASSPGGYQTAGQCWGELC